MMSNPKMMSNPEMMNNPESWSGLMFNESLDPKKKPDIWVMVRSKVNPLFHIDGSLNLANLLPKKHEIWIEGLDWLKKNRSNMQLLDQAHLRVEKPVIAEIMVECFPEPGKFSNAPVEPESEKEDSDDDTEEMSTPFSVLALCAGKSVARELLVDPVYHGWRGALRIVGYLQSWIRIHKHKTRNGIQWDCKLDSSLWDFFN